MANTVTSSSTTEATEEDGSEQYDNFLDDPYNMAMYVVLPAMILVYGGCCFIYCMAKLHSYCRRRSRRRARQRLIQKDDNNSDDNDHAKRNWSHRSASVSVVDLTDPLSEELVQPPQPVQPVKPAKPAKLPKPVVYPKPAKSATPEVHPSRAAPLVQPKPALTATRNSSAASRAASTNSSRAVQPGYVKPQDLHTQMQHLDNQLKAAFHLISKEPQTVKSRPDVCSKSNENQKSVNRRAAKSSMQFFVSDQ